MRGQVDPAEGPAARTGDLISYPHCLSDASCRWPKAGFLLQEGKAIRTLGQ